MQLRYRFGVRPVLVATALLAALSLPAGAAPNHHPKRSHAGATLRFAHAGDHLHGARHHHHAGFVTLSGDRESGLGFYPPAGRAYAHYYGRPYRGDQAKEDMREALINQSPYSFYGTGSGVPGEQHAHNMFNPVDGYGSPFFAGYYGPAGDPDDDRGPFGTPYND